VLTAQSFELLLGWLDPDREKAGEKYGKIHVRLIKLFSCRGCFEPEHLADEVIDRVASKIDWLIQNYVGGPELYFYGVARKVCLEELRRKPTMVLASPADESVNTDDVEEVYQCLEQCMDILPLDEHQLVLQYHQEEKQAKIRNRKQLAMELGVSLNALRIKVFRIHSQLEQCVTRCLEQVPAH
jgi:DNA-directed RNA polymerase specialized sigma24 family protein